VYRKNGRPLVARFWLLSECDAAGLSAVASPARRIAER